MGKILEYGSNYIGSIPIGYYINKSNNNMYILIIGEYISMVESMLVAHLI